MRVTFLADNPKYREPGDPQYELRKDEPKYLLIEYELGFKNFNGAPYQLVVDTPQKAYFEITPGELKGLYKVSLVQDGELVYDVKPTYDEGGNLVFLPEDAVNDRNNIFCDNIDIRFCRKVNLLDTLYYCWIETPQGDAVYDAHDSIPGRSSVTLIPHMLYGMEEVTKDCRIMWFREDLRIPEENNPSSADRDEWGRVWTEYTGPGWRPISQFVDELNDNYIEGSDGSLLVRKEGVPWQWRFKLVCVYQDATFGTAVVTVRRSDSKYDLEIEQITSKISDLTQLRINDKKAKVGRDINPDTGEFYPEWFGTWYVELVDNSYNQMYDVNNVPQIYHNGPVDINHLLKYEQLNFRVACYDPAQVVPPYGRYTGAEELRQVTEIGYLEYPILATKDGGLRINWEGIRHFNYTAAGKPYSSSASKDHTLAPKLVWAGNNASAYDIIIKAPDGQVLGPMSYYNANNEGAGSGEMTATGYDPVISMMYDIYCDHNNVVHFKIRQEWDADRVGAANNTFYCEVRTIADNEIYREECVVDFTKDGMQGTQGTEWTAPLKIVNTSEVEQRYTVNGVENWHNAAKYTMELGLQSYPLVLKPMDDKNKIYTQITDVKNGGTRVVLRPFVTKEGRRLEDMGDNERQHYRIKVFWDVRYPNSTGSKRASKASFLRLYDVVTGEPLGLPDNAYSGFFAGGKNEFLAPGKEAGLYGVTEWHGENPNYVDNPNFCAVEVRYEPNAGFAETLNGAPVLPLEHDEVNYNFWVRANVVVETDLETEMYRKTEDGITDFAYGTAKEKVWHRLKSITSWYPIDVFIHEHNPVVHFNPARVFTNWPQFISYDSRGYNAQVDADYLEFYYGMYPNSVMSREGSLIRPISITPMVEEVEEVQLSVETVRETNPEVYYAWLAQQGYQTEVSDATISRWRLKPRAHLNWQEGTLGCLSAKFDDAMIGEALPLGTFYRTQVYTSNQYENVDINSWDGQGIDINEDNGTIFAPTIGAGFKGPLTNNFTGVLMGVNTGFPRITRGINQYLNHGDATRKTEDPEYYYDPTEEEELAAYPYMTGLFGYQNGYSSFGLLENGTAFFGRADRGGRIIIDGYNATIYGGANGELGSPYIGDPMWNTMRLNLVDLTHQTGPEGMPNDFTGVAGIS